MKSSFFALPFCLACFQWAWAQPELISLGPGYKNFLFYSLEDGDTSLQQHIGWDIAFSLGGAEAGVWVNEGVASVQGPPPPQVELYLTSSADFSSVDTSDMIRLYNNELSWSEGAFNHVKDPADPFDLGWGLYNPVNNSVIGNRIYCLKLRDGSFKKLEIQSLQNGTYTFRYADLGSTDETVRTVAKSDFSGNTLAYYSFSADTTRALEPAKWDLVFTRYFTPLQDGNATIPYLVSGTLVNAGLQVAKAAGIDPVSVAPQDYADQYADSVNAIGYDWKTFNLNTFQWEIPNDRVYFVKNADNELWKLQFVDFEGSTTGNIVIERTALGLATSVESPFPALRQFDLYPNPASKQVNLLVEWDDAAPQSRLILHNALGQLILASPLDITPGLNARQVELGNLPAGLYQLSLEINGQVVTKSLRVQ